MVRKAGGSPVTVEEVKGLVKGQLSAYEQLRGGVEFIEQVPRNPSGKILRRMLRDQSASRTQAKL